MCGHEADGAGVTVDLVDISITKRDPMVEQEQRIYQCRERGCGRETVIGWLVCRNHLQKILFGNAR